MPSVGGLENSRNKDANLEHISTVISEELSGQTSTSRSKSSGFAPVEQGQLPKTKATMAPNKNGEVQEENKPKSAPEQTNGALTSSAKDPAGNKVLNGSEEVKSEGNGLGLERIPSKDDGIGMETAQADDTKEKNDGAEAEKEDGKKTAVEKRAEYKDRPRASSVEVLGLSKKLAKIKDQDKLRPELEDVFDSALKRRRSSPGKIRSAPFIIKPVQEDTTAKDIEAVTTNLGQMELSGNKSAGCVQRMEEERDKPNELTAKGPEKRMSVLPVRSAPYNAGQPCMQTTGYHGVQVAQPPMQHQHQNMMSPANQLYQTPSIQQYSTGQPVKVVCPPGKKLAAPGMRPMQNFTNLSDGRIMRNLPAYPSTTQAPQMLNAQGSHGREPEESTYNWPTSPTNQSQVSMSPDHQMQTDLSPVGYSPAVYSPGHPQPSPVAYSPGHPQPSPVAYSPGHPQPSPMMHSPQTVPSPADSNGMSTSPSSPGSPEYITLNSPHSVQSVESADSGIASPSHVSQYMTTSGHNSGTVIVNGNYPPFKQPTYQPRLTDDQEKQLKINKIVENLMAGYEPDISNANATTNAVPQNQVKLQHQEQPQHQQRQVHHGRHPLNSQSNIQQPNPPAMMPLNQRMPPSVVAPPQPQPLFRTQQQYIINPPQIHPQILPQAMIELPKMESIVNTMSLDLLCSQDEDEDTALHIAISQGEPSLCYAIIKRLVQAGRSDALNIKDKLGQTPVYVAVVTNQPNVVFELLQNGADIMIPNKEGMTPLHYAATKGYACALRAIGCSQLNLNWNWNINIENKQGMSPLQCAIQAHGRYEQIYDGNECRYVNKLVDSTDTITNLLMLDADPAFKDRRSGYTALHYAVELVPNDKVAKNVHIIKLILQVSQNAMELLNITNYAGNTPLHLIAGRDYNEDYVVSIIDLLISYGAEINVKNPEKHCPHDLVNKERRPKVYSRLQGDHLQGK